jgi:hypothetical protein
MKLTDAGLERVLLFDEGFDLPEFAAFPLVLSAPTCRASADWGRLLGYEGDELVAIDRRAVEFLVDLRDEMLEPGARDGVAVEA